MLGFGLAWSNHFHNGFHADDTTAIVNNRAIHSLAGIPRFFLSPRTFSDLPEQSGYRPLLATSFALDYAVGEKPNPAVYMMDSFVWFILLLLLLYGLFRLIPGSGHLQALFAATLFGLHPVAVDTVNYAARRGNVLGAMGVAAGLILWIYWPRLLPARLAFNTQRTTRDWQEEILVKQAERLNRGYRSILFLTQGVYLLPVVVAMLAEPSSVVFAPILVAWLAVFERDGGQPGFPRGFGRPLRSALPAAVVCGVYWFAQLAMAWTSAVGRLPLVAYWAAQPWVAVRSFCAFFFPIFLSADSDLQPFSHLFSPLALVGYGGLAGLVWLALATSRRTEWRTVSFGLWWFLLAMLPSSLVPGRAVESDGRLFLAFAGLALAATSGFLVASRRLAAGPRLIAVRSVYAVVLLSLAVQTYERNRIWESEETLWRDVLADNPRDGRAYINYGMAMMAIGDTKAAFANMKQATPLVGSDPSLEVDLGLAFDKLGMDLDAEAHLRKAIALAPSYARAYSALAQWLSVHQRYTEAFDLASKAARLDPADLIARETLMDLYSQRFDWESLKKVASETMRIAPEDPAAQRSVVMAQSSLDTIRKRAEQADANPSVNEYLGLSVLYFNNRRYDDSIAAARKALKIQPSLGEAYVNIAAAYHNLGKDDDAIVALREAVRLRPDITFARDNLNYLLANKGQAR